jgi:hypothetical protein
MKKSFVRVRRDSQHAARPWRFSVGIVALAMALGLIGAPAHANSVQIDWYAVTPGFPDFNLPPCGDCGQHFTNEVGPTLSGGRPVVGTGNPAGLAEAVGNPLQWWTVQSGVVLEGTTIQSLPINQNMFVPLGTGSIDDNVFQTAIISATIHVGAGGGSITFGGDDDMFLALSGNVVDQVGGIHPTGTLSTFGVGQGDYFMQIFYADRHVVAAQAFVNVSGDITTAVPEPSTWAMMIAGFGFMGFVAYRRRARLTPIPL